MSDDLLKTLTEQCLELYKKTMEQAMSFEKKGYTNEELYSIHKQSKEIVNKRLNDKRSFFSEDETLFMYYSVKLQTLIEETFEVFKQRNSILSGREQELIADASYSMADAASVPRRFSESLFAGNPSNSSEDHQTNYSENYPRSSFPTRPTNSSDSHPRNHFGNRPRNNSGNRQRNFSHNRPRASSNSGQSQTADTSFADIGTAVAGAAAIAAAAFFGYKSYSNRNN